MKSFQDWWDSYSHTNTDEELTRHDMRDTWEAAKDEFEELLVNHSCNDAQCNCIGEIRKELRK
jgi:hypothetical protein